MFIENSVSCVEQRSYCMSIVRSLRETKQYPEREGKITYPQPPPLTHAHI